MALAEEVWIMSEEGERGRGGIREAFMEHLVAG